MATFTFDNEFIKCGYFAGNSIQPSAQERIDKSVYYAPLIRSSDASMNESYFIEDFAEILNPNISFTFETLLGNVAILPMTEAYYYNIAALRRNNEYGASGMDIYKYKTIMTATCFILDSESRYNNAGGVADGDYSKVTLLYIILNDSICIPCQYYIEQKILYILYPANGVPLYNDLIIRNSDDIENPYNPGGTSKPDGGDGVFGSGEVSEDIKPMLPNGSAESDSSNSGLFTRYAMTASMLRTLGAALYTDDLLAKLGKEIMSYLYNSPAEAIISLMSYPFSISSIMGTSSVSIKFGSLELPVSGNRLNSTFAQIDWGTISLSPYWGNFLDYAPHTKIDLYLPWCTGSVQIDPHECYPGTISVVTNIELSKGTCIHNVFGNKGALIGSYSGVAGSQLPITAIDSAGKMLTLVTSAVALGVTAGTAAVGGAKALAAGEKTANMVRSAGGTAREAFGARNRAEDRVLNAYSSRVKAAGRVALASSIASFKTPQQVVRNGSFSGNGAGLGMQFPYIIISRPEQSVPEQYGRYFGYPSNIYVSSLSKVSGYTEVGSIHLDGIPCTDNERNEIEALLKGGVII